MLTDAEMNCLNYNCFVIKPFVNKNYTYTKLNCLKFISALHDHKRVNT